MNEEIVNICERNIYTLVFSLKEKKSLDDKWVYKIKTDQNSNAAKFKARWVVQNFHQWKEIDYNEIYVFMIDRVTIWILFAIAVIRKWKIKQMNFITVFLNDELLLNELILMKQSIEYENEKSFFWQLNQNLYRLKQSVRIWYNSLMKLLQKLEFICSQWDAEL